MTRKLAASLAVAMVGLLEHSARATDYCDVCGCRAHCHKVCRLVCETKKVPKITYRCECEDFCVPGPSEKCGGKCGHDCDAPCGEKCHDVYRPTCATVRTRAKLMKHEEMKEIPSHKWVVEYVCDTCAKGRQSPPPAATANAVVPNDALLTTSEAQDEPAGPAPEGREASRNRSTPLRCALKPLLGW